MVIKIDSELGHNNGKLMACLRLRGSEMFPRVPIST